MIRHSADPVRDTARPMDLCPGTSYDHRDQSDGRRMFRCQTCGRVARTTRPHREPGRTTTSHDKTMRILWDGAADTAPCPGVPFTDGTDTRRCPHPASEHGPHGCEYAGHGHGNARAAVSVHMCPCSAPMPA